MDKNHYSIKAYLKFCKITRTPYWVPKYSEEVVAVGDGSFEIDFDENNISNTDDFSRPFYDVKGSTNIERFV